MQYFLFYEIKKNALRRRYIYMYIMIHDSYSCAHTYILFNVQKTNCLSPFIFLKKIKKNCIFLDICQTPCNRQHKKSWKHQAWHQDPRQNILTGVPQYMVGEVFFSGEGLAAKVTSVRSVICMRKHMVR